MDVFVLRSVVDGGSHHTTQGGEVAIRKPPLFTYVCQIVSVVTYLHTHRDTQNIHARKPRERIHINLNTSIHTHVYKLYYYIQALVDYNYLLNEEIFIPKQNDKNAMHFPTYSLGSFPFRVIIIRCQCFFFIFRDTTSYY